MIHALLIGSGVKGNAQSHPRFVLGSNYISYHDNRCAKCATATKSKTAVTSIRGGARGVMVIVVGNEHGDTSSNPGRD